MHKPYRRPRTSPWRWGLLLLIPLLIAFFYWQNTAIQVTHTTVTLPTLPSSFQNTTVAVVADLQGMSFGADNQTLLQTVADQDPDYIFLVGDVVDRYRDVDDGYVPTLASGLSAIAPTYFVTGNHEWAVGDVAVLKQTLTQNGVIVLSNEFVTLGEPGDTLVIAGIDDPNGYADQKSPQALAVEVLATAPSCWILLAHRNDYFLPEYSLLGADLVVSGHGHGGLIRLPFTDGLIDHQGFFPSYTAGLYQENNSTLFVTRGLGSSSFALRLFNRPEVAMMTLQ